MKGGGGGAVWAGAVATLEGFLADPWLLRPAGAVGADADAATVQVEVPPLEPAPEDGEDEARRVAAQRGAAAAEDVARRFESGAYGSPVFCSIGSRSTPSRKSKDCGPGHLSIRGGFSISVFLLARSDLSTVLALCGEAKTLTCSTQLCRALDHQLHGRIMCREYKLILGWSSRYGVLGQWPRGDA